MKIPASFWTLLDRRVRGILLTMARPVRGVLTALDATQKAPLGRMEARAEEVSDAVEVAQHFGFASSPPVDTEVVAIPIGGSTGHLVIVGEMDRASRPTDLSDGETCIYCVESGTWICVSPDGTITITAAATITLVGGGGATKGVARKDDTCIPSISMAAWIALVGTATGVGAPGDSNYTINTASSTVKASG